MSRYQQLNESNDAIKTTQCNYFAFKPCLVKSCFNSYLNKHWRETDCFWEIQHSNHSWSNQ